MPSKTNYCHTQHILMLTYLLKHVFNFSLNFEMMKWYVDLVDQVNRLHPLFSCVSLLPPSCCTSIWGSFQELSMHFNANIVQPPAFHLGYYLYFSAEFLIWHLCKSLSHAHNISMTLSPSSSSSLAQCENAEKGWGEKTQKKRKRVGGREQSCLYLSQAVHGPAMPSFNNTIWWMDVSHRSKKEWKKWWRRKRKVLKPERKWRCFAFFPERLIVQLFVFLNKTEHCILRAWKPSAPGTRAPNRPNGDTRSAESFDHCSIHCCRANLDLSLVLQGPFYTVNRINDVKAKWNKPHQEVNAIDG